MKRKGGGQWRRIIRHTDKKRKERKKEVMRMKHILSLTLVLA